MRAFSVILISFCFILLGAKHALGIKKRTEAVGEAVRFAELTGRLIGFRAVSVSELKREAKNENFRYISFDGDSIVLDSFAGEKAVTEFSGFVRGIGTTDVAGQLSLCSEYSDSLKHIFSDFEKTQKEKSRVSAVLGVFAAFCTCILLL